MTKEKVEFKTYEYEEPDGSVAYIEVRKAPWYRDQKELFQVFDPETSPHPPHEKKVGSLRWVEAQNVWKYLPTGSPWLTAETAQAIGYCLREIPPCDLKKG